MAAQARDDAGFKVSPAQLSSEDTFVDITVDNNCTIMELTTEEGASSEVPSKLPPNDLFKYTAERLVEAQLDLANVVDQYREMAEQTTGDDELETTSSENSAEGVLATIGERLAAARSDLVRAVDDHRRATNYVRAAQLRKEKANDIVNSKIHEMNSYVEGFVSAPPMDECQMEIQTPKPTDGQVAKANSPELEVAITNKAKEAVVAPSSPPLSSKRAPIRNRSYATTPRSGRKAREITRYGGSSYRGVRKDVTRERKLVLCDTMMAFTNKTAKDAANAYDKAAREHHNHKAILNFATAEDIAKGCRSFFDSDSGQPPS